MVTIKITRKWYSIENVKASSTHVVLYCATSLGQLYRASYVCTSRINFYNNNNNNTQMVAVALGPWASHSEDRAEP